MGGFEGARFNRTSKPIHVHESKPKRIVRHRGVTFCGLIEQKSPKLLQGLSE
jgi:hypothetical protein